MGNLAPRLLGSSNPNGLKDFRPMIIFYVKCYVRKWCSEYNDGSKYNDELFCSETSAKPTQNGTKKNADTASYMDGIDNLALHQTEHPAIIYGKSEYNISHYLLYKTLLLVGWP